MAINIEINVIDDSVPMPWRTTEAGLKNRKRYQQKVSGSRRESRITSIPCPTCGNPRDSRGYRCSKCKLENANKISGDTANPKLCCYCEEPACNGHSKCINHLYKYFDKEATDNEGKCCRTNCNKVAVKDEVLCNHHLRSKESYERVQKRLKDAGICKHCRNAPVSEGHVVCDDCREKQRLAARQRKLDRNASGVCILCGRKRDNSSNKCTDCYIKDLARDNGLNASAAPDLLNKLIQQEYKCVYSGQILDMGVNSSLDHIIPISRGGTSHLSNLQWTTRAVNQLKGNLLEDELLILNKQIYTNCINKEHN